jgi:protein SCO1/2
LTGDLGTIIDVGKPLAVAVEHGERLPSGGYEVTHSTHVTAINDHDRVPIVWTQGTSAAQFADDIHRLLEEAPR